MNLKDLAPGQIWVIRPETPIQALMTGAVKVGLFASGETWVLYEDGEKEIATLDPIEAQVLADKMDFPAIVSAVQSKRKL